MPMSGTYNTPMRCFSAIMVGDKGNEINRGGKSESPLLFFFLAY